MSQFETSAAKGQVLRIAQTGWPTMLAPQTASLTNELAVLAIAYEGLTRIDEQLQTVPAAAESWEYNADATTIAFRLRPDLCYSDGSPLVAADFIQAVRRTLDPRYAGNYQTLLGDICGADAIIALSEPIDLDQLERRFEQLGVHAPDERTIVFELCKPTSFFHTMMSLWVMYPVKQALIDRGGPEWYLDPANQIGNGPFQLTRIDPEANLIEYRANERYWRGRPRLDAVRLVFIDDKPQAFERYLAGDIDVLNPDPSNMPQIKADPRLSREYLEYPGACTLVFELNLTKPPFDNRLVREAFAYAFDRAGYIRDMLNETELPTLTWIPQGYPGHDSGFQPFAFNPAMARQRLAEAGYPDGKGLPPITFSYNQNNPANQRRTEYLIAMYRQHLGITIVPAPIEDGQIALLRRSTATFPQMLTGGGWCADYPDPQNWLSVYWHSRSGVARTIGYANQEVDRLLDHADAEVEPRRRLELYQAAQRLILADAAQLIRGHTKNGYLIKPHVRGLEVTAQDAVYPGQITGLFNVTLAPMEQH